MTDLTYIVGIGFSGADIARAITITFFITMLSGTKNSVWFLAFVSLLIDRLAWPIISMAVSGHDMNAIGGAYIGMAASFMDDLGFYVVRYLGLTVLIGVFRWLRISVHRPGSASRKASAKPALG